MSLFHANETECMHAGCYNIADFSCDYPMKDGSPCNRKLCAMHAHPISNNIDYCTKHLTEHNAKEKAYDVVA